MASLKGWRFSVKLVYRLCRTTAGKLRPNWWLKQWNESHLKIWSLNSFTPVGLWVVLERQFFSQSQFSSQKDAGRPWSLSFLFQCLRIGVLDMRAFHAWPLWSSGPPEGFCSVFPHQKRHTPFLFCWVWDQTSLNPLFKLLISFKWMPALACFRIYF